MSKPLNIAGRAAQKAMPSYAVPLASLVIFLIGVIALMITPREENPQIDVPAANVYVQLPGADSQEVLNQIIRPLESVLSEMPGVDHTYGMASNSMGVVTVQFEVGEEKEQSLVKLYDRLEQNKDRIPPMASAPLVKPLDVDDVPIVAITLSSQHYNDLDLKRLALAVKEQLSPLPGISVADIIGGRNREITVEINPDRLAGRGIDLGALKNILSNANIDRQLGYTVEHQQVKNISLYGALRSATEIGDIIVAIKEGRPVYLRDVADIRDGVGDIETVHRIGFGPASDHKLSLDEPEQMAVTITLAKKRGINAVVASQAILDKLETLKGDFIPDDVTVTVTRNSGERADDAVDSLVEHLAIAIFSVIVIMLLFLGWREASIVTLNIPLILFIVLAIGFLADQTINRITLFSLILALGLLVDDAIVVVENIHRHLNDANASIKNKAQLIIQAANETGRPTIIATFAVILAFIPMGFVTGMMGPYMGPIPFNTVIAMLASLVIAYMFTPWLAQYWLPLHDHQASVNFSGNEPTTKPDRIQQLYIRLATPLFEHTGKRRLFWGITLILLLIALWQPAWQFARPGSINSPMTAGTVELKMLPKGNTNTFNITIDMPEGTPLEITDAVARDIGNVLRRHPMIKNYETHSGMAGPVDFNGMLRGAVGKSGPHIAEIRVNLTNKHDRAIKSEAIVLELRDWLKPLYQQYPDAVIKLAEDPPGPPVRATLLAEIYGPDYEQSRALAKTVRNHFEQTRDLVDIDDSIGDNQRKYRVIVDKEKAAASGIDTRQVADLLHNFISGFNIGTLHSAIERTPIMINIQIPRHFRISPRDMDRLFITNPAGQQIPITAIAHIEEVISDKPIFTKDSHPVVYVSAEPAAHSQVYPLLELDGRLDKTLIRTGGLGFVTTTPDDTFEPQLLWDGEMRLTLDVFRDLGLAFIVGIVLIYLLLVTYYASFTLPLIVMGAIPLTLIGIFPGHMLMGQPFTATSMIGMIALAGIVVRNSLLLIDFIRENQSTASTLQEAVITAGAVRARPILLTALAVIAGTSIMISDPVFGGLGVSMAFGTLASTLLTLFVIPLLYFYWQQAKHTTNPTLKETSL